MKDIPFENAFERLEEILSSMNEGKVSLDTSLKLFEEADTLIKSCNQKLSDAEKKIEVLLKTRNGDIKLENDKVQTEELYTNKNKLL